MLHWVSRSLQLDFISYLLLISAQAFPPILAHFKRDIWQAIRSEIQRLPFRNVRRKCHKLRACDRCSLTIQMLYTTMRMWLTLSSMDRLNGPFLRHTLLNRPLQNVSFVLLISVGHSALFRRAAVAFSIIWADIDGYSFHSRCRAIRSSSARKGVSPKSTTGMSMVRVGKICVDGVSRFLVAFSFGCGRLNFLERGR